MKYYFLLLWVIFSAFLSAQEEFTTRYLYQDIHLQAKFTYKEGILIERCFYYYNAHNECDKIVIDNGSSEDPNSFEGVTGQLTMTFAFTEECHIKMTQTFFNLITGEEKLIKEVDISCWHQLIDHVMTDPDGNCIETLYNPESHELAVLEDTPEGLKKITTFFYDTEGNLTSILKKNETKENESCKSSFAATFYEYIYSQESSFLDKWKKDFEYVAQFLMRPTVFRISGYHTHPAHIGVHGTGEISEKVRITLINGILNYPPVQTTHLEMFSKLHGGVNIHHTFRPCEGWSIDMLRCTAAKLGIISKEARTLAKTWKKLIAEMGGAEGGGVIIHYAHSIGGTETDNAKRLMTPEELKMIRVYTLASPTIISNEGFQSVMNYVSKRDGVCYLNIDYFSGLFLDSNIVYVGTWYGIPLIDHLITNKSYRAVIEKLGQEFVNTYGTVNSD